VPYALHYNARMLTVICVLCKLHTNNHLLLHCAMQATGGELGMQFDDDSDEDAISDNQDSEIDDNEDIDSNMDDAAGRCYATLHYIYIYICATIVYVANSIQLCSIVHLILSTSFTCAHIRTPRTSIVYSLQLVAV
jgi:hypothetical protein